MKETAGIRQSCDRDCEPTGRPRRLHRIGIMLTVRARACLSSNLLIIMVELPFVLSLAASFLINFSPYLYTMHPSAAAIWAMRSLPTLSHLSRHQVVGRKICRSFWLMFKFNNFVMGKKSGDAMRTSETRARTYGRPASRSRSGVHVFH